MMADHIKNISEIKNTIAQVGKPIYITLSGSDLYGFPSKDSDYDYRGSYIIKTEFLLGLDTPKNEIAFETILGESKTVDAVIFELKKEIGLALASNCNVLEHLYAKPLFTTPYHFELQDLVERCINKTGLYNSYRGMAFFNYKKFILGNQPTVKKYLYVFRALLSGMYALREGNINPNLRYLAEFFNYKDILELIQIKIDGEEKGKIVRIEKYDKLVDDLFISIDREYKLSHLPEKPDKTETFKLGSWLKKMRKDYID